MTKMVHSCIRVLNGDRSVARYKDALDLDVVDQLDCESFLLTYLRNAASEFELELTLNKARQEEYDLGDGYAHRAFVVEDAGAHQAALTSKGIEVDDLVDFPLAVI